ncbi:hypothetical protein ACFT2C_05915 [Promicromonospora sp. NPDC057138]|uniref:hypothetical protein n=1 Tax=Promicromonospora sp. NPDC057138 TaxID=3346031 RepID=UPI00362F1B8B
MHAHDVDPVRRGCRGTPDGHGHVLVSAAATLLGFLFFAAAAVVTALRSRKAHGGDSALPVGLSFLAVASLARLDPVEQLLIAKAPSATYEVVKHLTFTVGAVAIIAWVHTALTGRGTNFLLLWASAAAAAIAMLVLFIANDPWTNDDLTNQTSQKPWMALYWLIYCVTGGLAAGAFGVSALRASRAHGLRYGWGMAIAVLGAASGTAWAVVSLINHASGSSHARESPLGQTANALITVSTVLLCIGGIGHLVLAIVRRRRRQEDLRALHDHLASAVAETRLDSSRVGLAEYHATIEIMDALAVLARYSSVSDVEHVRAAVGDASREVHLAYQIDIAAARRGMDDQPARSEDWSTWLSDDEALRRLGRAFRDRTTPESRQRVVEQVVGA